MAEQEGMIEPFAPDQIRIWSGAKGSIMPSCSAMRRIHRSDLMLKGVLLLLKDGD